LYYNLYKKASISEQVLVNPLFNQGEEEDKRATKKGDSFAFQHRKGKTIQPVSKDLRASNYQPVIPQVTSSTPTEPQNRGAAVELIRQKVASLYIEEPDVKEELAESVAPAPRPMSKHQQFMQQLSTSGKSLAQIQTEWHQYYVGLPDNEKHEVWQEFYQNSASQMSAYTSYVTSQQQDQATAGPQPDTKPAQLPENKVATVGPTQDHLPNLNFEARKRRREDRANKGKGKGGALKKQILDKVSLSSETQSKTRQQLQSLVFGLGTGVVVLVIFLFGFFNEVIIAPFIQPSRHVSATPIIMNSDSVAASDTPEVIIPKINVQIPTVFDNSVNEEDIQNSLENGVTHYPTTALPGQQGNTAFFGHSSNNIFNKGKYKFAFVLLHELVPGDTFYLTYGKKVYTYRVYDKKIVSPSEVSVLNNVAGKAATATLITCDPPGTSTNRLVVWGEQISPDPSTASAATPSTAATTDSSSPTALPSNGPTLFGRFWNWLTN
jgi:LPXTG-site transpeptidase (sortase) family protein